MIQPARPEDELQPASRPASRAHAPWEAPGALRPPSFVTLWATGPDPGRDGVFRLQALRPRASGEGLEAFDAWCDPFAGRESRQGGKGGDDGHERVHRATARMAREFGVTRAELEHSPPAHEAFEELAAFLEGAPVVTLDRPAFVSWSRELATRAIPRVLDLGDVAAVLAPGRLARGGPGTVARLLADRSPARPDALGPDDLRTALALLVGRTLQQDEATLAVLTHGYTQAWRALELGFPNAAADLALLLALCESPSRWCDREGALFPDHAALGDGRLSDAIRAWHDVDAAADAALPRWTPTPDTRRPDPLPPFVDDGQAAPLEADDQRRVDEIFQEHLPRLSGATELAYRPGQHAVAARIASTFGERGLELLHAPTGTGKTLAYLVPTMLWAFRNGVRVGVATFTRALQEQAIDRDVPAALELLRRAGVGGDLRVSILKGRTNYLCWRALRLEAPLPDDPPERVLAWTALALFALGDDDGDLDRLPRRPPLAHHASIEGGELGRLLRRARAEPGCCTLQTDRDTCGADAARRRAERSHVVITNHAFALSRRDFFRHLVFDECEHLHDVAHNAFSHTVSMRRLRGLLARMYAAGAERPPLNRLQAFPAAGEAANALAQSIVARLAADRAAEELDDTIVGFEEWRDALDSSRKESDRHSLFREYVQEEDADELLVAHRKLAIALNELSAGLAGLVEHIDSFPKKGVLRIRRALDVIRTELDEVLAGVEAWIPRDDDGRPRFRRQTFYDLETTPRGDHVLAARVLLPHEYLGRLYYPDLAGAVMLSATTWLGGGFEAQSCFLGLKRAAEPTEDEDREPCHVESFRAPEAFDYGRVLVAVPRDAPVVREKHRFLDYVARFLGFLAERSRGRVLALFTNGDDLVRTGRELERFFAERHLPFWYQRMDGATKEELSERFRSTTDSVLLGLDTFWYGADFPGPTLEYLVIVRLPYGVPDRYHHAQAAALGNSEQRKQIYMPRALAKLRQGFGRLMRKETDKGCVFVLDQRILDPRHRAFLRELPVRRPMDTQGDDDGLARFVAGDTDRCLHEAFAHMDMLADVERRGLARSFRGWHLEGEGELPAVVRESAVETHQDIRQEDIPF